MLMKYLRRSIKYFFYLAIILTLVVFVLILLKVVEPDPAKIFRNGYDSFWQIGIFLMLFAGVYPRYGFTTRRVHIPGSFDEIRPGTAEYMDLRGYRLDKIDGEDMVFCLRAPFNRLTRMFEDKVTMTRTFDGFEIEGPSKDVVRIVSGLENKFNREDE